MIQSAADLSAAAGEGIQMGNPEVQGLFIAQPGALLELNSDREGILIRDRDKAGGYDDAGIAGRDDEGFFSFKLRNLDHDGLDGPSECKFCWLVVLSIEIIGRDGEAWRIWFDFRLGLCGQTDGEGSAARIPCVVIRNRQT